MIYIYIYIIYILYYIIYIYILYICVLYIYIYIILYMCYIYIYYTYIWNSKKKFLLHSHLGLGYNRSCIGSGLSWECMGMQWNWAKCHVISTCRLYADSMHSSRMRSWTSLIRSPAARMQAESPRHRLYSTQFKFNPQVSGWFRLYKVTRLYIFT